MNLRLIYTKPFFSKLKNKLDNDAMRAALRVT